jgi:hypothetical protein
MMENRRADDESGNKQLLCTDYETDDEPYGWREEYQAYWIERYGSMYITNQWEGMIIYSQEERIRDHMRDSFIRSYGYHYRYKARLVYNLIMSHCLNPIIRLHKAIKTNPTMIISPGEAELQELARLANLQCQIALNGWTWIDPQSKKAQSKDKDVA